MSNSHHHHTHKFPKGFLWGTATSSHQVEGNNHLNDWWRSEEEGKLRHKSGRGIGHFHKYKEDFDLAKKMNTNAHRLSIEWSRIEPKCGEWSEDAIEHYRKVLASLKKRNIRVMLTLHHFTLPQWFADKGGFEKRKNIKYFSRYVKFITEEVGEYVDIWITINEPGVYIYQSYMRGGEDDQWPPFKKSTITSLRVYWNLVIAHRKTYHIIHSVCDDNKCSSQVGISQNVLSFATYRKHGLIDNLVVWLAVNFANHGFYYLSGKKKTHDFLGLNYYFRVSLKRTRGSLHVIQDDISGQGRETSDIGWEIYPRGLFDVLMDFRDYKLPIYITENGIATSNDDRRQRFIVAHLNEVYHAIKGGTDIRGYFHWSLLDNFEWHLGYAPKFGLIGVNRSTLKRTLKFSGKLYGEIAKENGLIHKMMRYLGHETKL